MPAIFDFQHVVTAEEIDAQGHVGNVVFLEWMQDAALEHSAAQGWPPERYQQTGAGWVVRSHQIEYLQPAFQGDRLVVRTWVADFQKLTSRRRYRILKTHDRATTVLAEAETNWVYIGFERRLPRRIPDELSAAFEVVSDNPGDNPGDNPDNN
jgi:acyl-CoA thioester hydrolase